MVDWARSAAYAVFFPHTRAFGIVLNRAGTKREGWVQAHDAETLLGRLRQDLSALIDEGGRRVVREIRSREEMGATAPGFPDLIVETETPFLPTDGLLGQRLFGPAGMASGLHEREGVFVLSGPTVRGEGEVLADIVDVAPTALRLLGVAPPEAMEGHALEEFFDLPEGRSPAGAVAAPGGAATITTEEQAEIEAHLQTLGYLE